MRVKNQFNPKRYTRYYGYSPKVYMESAMLIFDIVGFSKVMKNKVMMEKIEKMHKCIYEELAPIYYWNEKKKHSKKNDFILIPTGDGYGIVLNNIRPDEEIFKIASSLYKRFAEEKIKIRVGIAKGWNVIAQDANEDLNVFGYGIVLATRICNAAKEEQILVDSDFVNALFQNKEMEELQEIKEPFYAKHDLPLQCYNYFKQNEFGIPNILSI